jgi:DUF4097 and DUF4098 domain-containing protein YvlB
MPVYATPDPIRARIDASAATVSVRASERSDTVVEVRPANPRSSADVQAAEQTRVDYAAGSLHVSTPRRPRLLLFGTGPTVEIDVSLPDGSDVDVDVTAGDVRCDGRFDDVEVDSKYGEVRIDTAASVRARTQAGDITVGVAVGRVEASTAYGSVRVARASGDLRLDSACGDISVDRADGSVDAATKYGEVRVGEAVRGELTLETAYGTVTAGIRAGTAAWLDLSSGSGTVRNSLAESDGPEGATETLRVRARTAYGDVVIRRP